MSLASARGQLKSAMSHLLLHWDEVTARWDDPASRAFEKDFVRPLEPPARASLTAMEAMNELLAKARRECS